MLQYQKIDVSEGVDVNKTSASKECALCHYWFFKGIGSKFGLFFKRYSNIERKMSYF